MYKHHTNQLPPILSTYFTKHVQTHNYPTRNAQDYSINITKKMFSDRAIRNCGPSFWNYLDKTLKPLQNHQTLPKWTEISFTVCIQLISLWGMSCVLASVCKVFKFLKVSVYLLKPLLRVCLSQAFLAFKSCPQYHVVFFMLVCFDVWYWNKVWYDMIWYHIIKTSIPTGDSYFTMNNFQIWLNNCRCYCNQLTLIYPAHFEDVPCQSGVNHIYEG